MPLLIDFKPHDRLIINGAVIENQGAHSKLLVLNQASILRGKEVVSVEDAVTPASRAYYALQCAYVFKEQRDEYLKSFESYLADYVTACPSAAPIADKIREETAKGRLYAALKESQKLIFHEGEILENLSEKLKEVPVEEAAPAEE